MAHPFAAHEENQWLSRGPTRVGANQPRTFPLELVQMGTDVLLGQERQPSEIFDGRDPIGPETDFVEELSIVGDTTVGGGQQSAAS